MDETGDPDVPTGRPEPADPGGAVDHAGAGDHAGPGDHAAALDPSARLVAHDEIRMLVSRYAVAVDARDLDTLVSLFVDDVRVGRETFGRAALRESFAASLSAIGVSILHVGTHVIDLVDADRATGTQYSAGQIEEGGRWIHQSIVYRDTYERRDGRWLFVRRVHELFHGVEAWRNPLDQEPAEWPRRSAGRGTAPGTFATWGPFWDGREGGPP